jgi:hypothetical protein
MTALQRALERHQVQEQEREAVRALRRAVTLSILRAGRFDPMRRVIPLWWEWVCTGLVASDLEIAAWIDQRLADSPGLQTAIIDEWA